MVCYCFLVLVLAGYFQDGMLRVHRGRVEINRKLKDNK